MTRFDRVRDILIRPSTWVAVLAFASAVFGIFGTVPTAQWEGVKDPQTGKEMMVEPAQAPPSAIVYKGEKKAEVDQEAMADKISLFLTLLFSVLAAILGQNEKPRPPKDDTENPFKYPLVPALLLAASLPLVGCAGQQTPIQRVDAARETYVATLNTLTPLMTTGVIPPSQHESLYQARLAAATKLDKAEAAALAGQTLNFDYLMRRVNASLDKLLAAKLKANRTQRIPEGSSTWNPSRSSPWPSPSSDPLSRLWRSTAAPSAASS